jgi:hypothetical protein
MLYNTKWEKTSTDVHSLDSLIAWLEKQPADGIYQYADTKNCLLCQYYTAMGFRHVSASSKFVSSKYCVYGDDPKTETVEFKLPPHFNDIALRCNGGLRTFGKALAYAYKVKSQL